MNSTARVQAALASFLADPEPGVLALKGDWGVGKTYIWRDFIGRQKMVPGYTSYSYVSLFGINGIPDLRRAIFVNQRHLGAWYHRVRLWWKRFSSGTTRHVDVNVAPVNLQKVGLKNTELWAEAIEASSMQQCIVCLDDLERKEGDKVSTSALLGLITGLRDERRCKVILLYNATKVGGLESFDKDLSEYREKVIDREVVLQPTVRECYSLIFSDGSYDLPSVKQGPSNPFQLTDTRPVVELFEALGLANIRVMRKTYIALGYFAAELKTKYPKLWPVFARQVVKLSCLHYLHGRDFKLDEIVNHQRWIAILAGRKKDDTFDKKYAPVNKISYHPTATDKLIVEYLTTGYVDWAAHGVSLTEEEGEQERAELGSTYHANWNLLWDNFQTTQQEFIDEQTTFLWQHQHQMSLSEVGQVAEFLLRLSPNPRAEDALTAKINEFVATTTDDRPFDTHFMTVSKEIALRVHEKLAAKVVVKPLPEAIGLMVRDGGWNPSDLKYLARVSEADFLNWLKTETSSGLLNQLKVFRQRFSGEAAGDAIIERLDTALQTMSKRSKADAIRVSSVTGRSETGTDPTAQSEPNKVTAP